MRCRVLARFGAWSASSGMSAPCLAPLTGGDRHRQTQGRYGPTVPRLLGKAVTMAGRTGRQKRECTTHAAANALWCSHRPVRRCRWLPQARYAALVDACEVNTMSTKIVREGYPIEAGVRVIPQAPASLPRSEPEARVVRAQRHRAPSMSMTAVSTAVTSVSMVPDAVPVAAVPSMAVTVMAITEIMVGHVVVMVSVIGPDTVADHADAKAGVAASVVRIGVTTVVGIAPSVVTHRVGVWGRGITVVRQRDGRRQRGERQCDDEKLTFHTDFLLLDAAATVPRSSASVRGAMKFSSTKTSPERRKFHTCSRARPPLATSHPGSQQSASQRASSQGLTLDHGPDCRLGTEESAHA